MKLTTIVRNTLIALIFMMPHVGCQSDKEVAVDSSALSNDREPPASGTGTLAWVRSAGGELEDSGGKIASFADDSFVVIGSYNILTKIGLDDVPVIFGSDEPNETVLATPSGEWHGGEHYIAKYNADGSLEWVRNIIDSGWGWATEVLAIDDGSAIVSGSINYSYGDTIFGLGEENETRIVKGPCSGDCSLAGTFTRAFLARFNPDGTLAWVRVTNGRRICTIWDIEKLPGGAILAAGEFSGEIVFGPGEINETKLVSSEDSNAKRFIARYSADGSLEWVKRQEDTCYWEVEIASLSDGSFVAKGHVRNFMGVKGGDSETEQASEETEEDGEELEFGWAEGDVLVVAKYNPEGDLLWERALDGCGEGEIDDLAVLSDDSIVAIGNFQCPGPITVSKGESDEAVIEDSGRIYELSMSIDESDIVILPGAEQMSSKSIEEVIAEMDLTRQMEPNRVFMVKYSPDGAFVFARSILENYTDVLLSDIAALSDDNYAITGFFDSFASYSSDGTIESIFFGELVFGKETKNELTLVADGMEDIWLAKFGSDGEMIWAERAGGPDGIAFKGGMYDMGRGVAGLSDGSVLITGVFGEYATFDGQDPNETVLSSAGMGDIFIAKYAP